MITISPVRVQAQNTFNHYLINPNAKPVDFFDKVDHIEIIGMEETTNSLIGDASYYASTGDGFIISDQKNKELYIFSEGGDFLYKISNEGQGPDEYGGFSYSWINKDHLEFYDGLRKNLHRYSKEGQLVGVIKARVDKNWRTGMMYPLEDGYVVNMLDRSPGQRSSVSVIFLDKDLSLSATVEKKSKPHPFPINLGKRFSKLGDETIYKPVLGDTLFLVKDQKLIPLAKLDFGDLWLWNDDEVMNNINAASQALSHDSEHVFEVLADVGPEMISLTYFYNFKEIKKGFIEKSTGSFHPFDLRKGDRTDFDLDFLQWERERLVSTLQSFDIEEFLEKLDSSQWKIRGDFSLSDLSSSENPILLKISFKH